jgi:hypothetical protein
LTRVTFWYNAFVRFVIILRLHKPLHV